MIITVQLKGPLKKYGSHHEQVELEYNQDAITVKALTEQLKIPASSISFIQIDGQKSNPETTLRGGEVVVVNPRVAGG